MRRFILLVCIGLLSWSLAQIGYGQRGPKSSGMAPQGQPFQDTVVGCLIEENGQLVLSDNTTGNNYLLSGHESKLRAHIGQLMSVQGHISGLGRPGAMSANEQMQPTVSVRSFQQLSCACNSTHSVFP